MSKTQTNEIEGIKAFVKFRTSIPGLHKDAKAHNYKYVSLDNIMDNIIPLAEANGFRISHQQSEDEKGEFLVTKIEHVSGWTDATRTPLRYAVNNDTGKTMQSMGSALTYARRYGISCLLGITADEDDDGSKAGKAKYTLKLPKTQKYPGGQDVPINDLHQFAIKMDEFMGNVIKAGNPNYGKGALKYLQLNNKIPLEELKTNNVEMYNQITQKFGAYDE
tara:strand:+ start:28191 stop:28850 length:660 start_codon:yes stop_codon:yes gene_type:complete